MSLEEYRRRRSFKSTSEPRPSKAKREAGKQLRFVVQKHDASRLHYDFRLELGGVLKSWAVPKGPSLDPKDKRLAMKVEDHPLSYADFEGAIPRGEYGAGDVIVWDRGVYSSIETAEPREAERILRAGLKKGELKIALYGEKLRGGFALVEMKGRNAWLLVKERDEYASEKDVRSNVKSVIGGASLPRDVELKAGASKSKKRA